MTPYTNIATASLLTSWLLLLAGCASEKSASSPDIRWTDPAYTPHASHSAMETSQAGKLTIERQLANMASQIQRLERIAYLRHHPLSQKTGTQVRVISSIHPYVVRSQLLKMADMMDVMMEKLRVGLVSGAMKPSASLAESSMGMKETTPEERIERVAMMGTLHGKGASAMVMTSSTPGIPGLSHLNHVGARGFFLDLPERIPLSAGQRILLSRLKTQVTWDKVNTDRRIQMYEQGLWMLTIADRPDNAKIEGMVAELERLRGDARLRFISAIENAVKILTKEQSSLISGSLSLTHSIADTTTVPVVDSSVGNITGL